MRRGSRTRALSAYAAAMTTYEPETCQYATRMPARPGPSSVLSASEIRSSALAFWMSSATRGTMLAIPGWNIAVAAPLSAISPMICHSGTLSEEKRRVASVSMASMRATSAQIIIS
ncbi:hypothetical protein GCM10010253_03540 [Streptomyces badius]|uniref:Uncharacterized protein n=1 Tax=Streptomyces badius TaxID=1941 RepID=A0ABQ2SP34_STRBA|nr:hypothetical protein GCM10010253_03540 [Streptomyces badius]